MLFQVPKFIYTIKEQKFLFIPVQGKFHNGLRWQEVTDSVEHIEKQVKTKSWKKKITNMEFFGKTNQSLEFTEAPKINQPI